MKKELTYKQFVMYIRTYNTETYGSKNNPATSMSYFHLRLIYPLFNKRKKISKNLYYRYINRYMAELKLNTLIEGD